MSYTVRLYATLDQEQRAAPVATVVLTDQWQRACWVPTQVTADARFYLERIETTDPAVEQHIRAVLQQSSVPVSRASAHHGSRVRTRGDYTAPAPYGTPAYWRVAIGLLERQAELRYDLQDYGRLLAAMEATVHPAEQPDAATVRAPGAPLAQRLAAALQRLADMRQDLAPRLQAWGEQVARGAVLAETAVWAVLTAGQRGTVDVLQALSHPSVAVSYAGAGITKGVRRRGGAPSPIGQATNAVDITTDTIPNGARVVVEADTVRAMFLDWQASSPPLLVLVPDAPGGAPRVPDRVEGEGDTWTVQFIGVSPGAYLLAVAPPSV